MDSRIAEIEKELSKLQVNKQLLLEQIKYEQVAELRDRERVLTVELENLTNRNYLNERWYYNRGLRGSWTYIKNKPQYQTSVKRIIFYRILKHLFVVLALLMLLVTAFLIYGVEWSSQSLKIAGSITVVITLLFFAKVASNSYKTDIKNFKLHLDREE